MYGNKKKVLELNTPCGNVTVKKNGSKIPFYIVDSDYNTMWITDEETKDEIAIHPDRCVEIIVDLVDMRIEDIITCSIESLELENDGRGEHRFNMVGNNNGFDIGIGAFDTEDLEYGYQDTIANMPSDMNKTKRYLCYHTDFINNGFEFEILDDSLLYRDRPSRKNIFIMVAWCDSFKPYSYEIVGFLTS